MFDYEYRIAVALGYLNSLVECECADEGDLHNLMILIDPEEDDEELIIEAINYARSASSVADIKLALTIKDVLGSANDLQYVCDMMQRNDPNGDYSVQWLRDNAEAAIEVLQQWKEDCDVAPGWLVKCLEIMNRQK